MSDALGVRRFGYRSPRFPFPKMVNLEIPQGVTSRVIGTHGIDISVDGIAVAADYSLDPVELVTVVIPLADGSVARFPGRVLCQSEDHCRFAFEFATVDQRAQIEELISGLARVQ